MDDTDTVEEPGFLWCDQRGAVGGWPFCGDLCGPHWDRWSPQPAEWLPCAAPEAE